MVPKGLPSVEFRPWSVSCGASFFRAFFRRLFFPIFGDVGSIWAGFGKPKRKPKSIFGRFFFDVFFECVSASNFDGFWKARNLKNSNFLLEKQ